MMSNCDNMKYIVLLNIILFRVFFLCIFICTVIN